MLNYIKNYFNINFFIFYALAAQIHSSNEVFHLDIADIGYVGAFVKGILSTGVDAEELLLVFDVDGTLTMCSTPSINKSNYPARPNAISVLNDAIKLNINVAISSAARNFKNTLRKLQFLGVASEIGIPLTANAIPAAKSLETFHTLRQNQSNKDEQFVSYQNGLVVSAREAGLDTAFTRKALATIFALPKQKLAKIKRIVVIDDNIDYLKTFSKDIKSYFPKIFGQIARFDYWKLTTVNDCN